MLQPPVQLNSQEPDTTGGGGSLTRAQHQSCLCPHHAATSNSSFPPLSALPQNEVLHLWDAQPCSNLSEAEDSEEESCCCC